MKTYLITGVLSLMTLSSFAVASEPFIQMTPAVEAICPQPNSNDGVAQLRSKYVCEIENYLPLVKTALAETDSTIEHQAKVLNKLRREIGLKYKELTPRWLLSMVYCRNQKIYNDPLGPTYETLIAKGKNDSEIAASASRTGGRDLLLDNPVAVTLIDFVNYMNLGNAFEKAWSWLPGEACPMID